MNENRRSLLGKTLFGAGAIGLRAMATGIPVSFLSRPLSAVAEEFACADKNKAQYVIIATSASGDPLNANVPGTYDFAEIVHAPDPRMAATDMTLAGKSVKGAQIWSTLPQWLLDRTAFFHHGTFTNSHANLSKVMQMMGATAKQEMLPSIFAKFLAPCFGSVQVDPVSAGAGDILSIDGRSLPNVAPTGLRDLLTKANTPLNRLQDLRDTSLDEIHALLKDRGTKAQKNYLDSVAMSRRQARSLGGDVLDLLSTIKTDNADGQVLAAISLIRMNVSSVITIRIPMGGDNHTDADLAKSEVPQQEAGVATIAKMWEQLQAAGLQDKVTFAMYNVFGRTLKKNGTTGRDHWGSHHATVMMGKAIKGGVIGGLEPKAMDYYATAIDSQSGASLPGGGDIPFSETLSAMGKTLGAAVGVLPATLDRYIAGGKIVKGALS